MFSTIYEGKQCPFNQNLLCSSDKEEDRSPFIHNNRFWPRKYNALWGNRKFVSSKENVIFTFYLLDPGFKSGIQSFWFWCHWVTSTLVDKDTELNTDCWREQAIQGNAAMKVAPPGEQICNQWCQLVVKFVTFQLLSPNDQFCDQWKTIYPVSNCPRCQIVLGPFHKCNERAKIKNISADINSRSRLHSLLDSL